MGGEPCWSSGFVAGGPLVERKAGTGWAAKEGRRPGNGVIMVTAGVGRPGRCMVRLYASKKDDLGFSEGAEAAEPRRIRRQKEIFQGPESVIGVTLSGVAVLIDVLKSVVITLTGPPSTKAKLGQRIRSLEQQASSLRIEKEDLIRQNEKAPRVVERIIQAPAPSLDEFQQRVMAAEAKAFELEAALQVNELAKANTMAQLNAMRDMDDNRDAAVEAVNREKTRLQAQIEKLTLELDRRDQTATEAGVQLQSVATELEANKGKVGELEGQVTELKAQLQALEALEKTGDQLKAERDELNKQLKDAEKTGAKLEKKAGALADEVAAAVEELTAARAERKQASKDRAKLQAANEDLQSELEAAKSRILTLDRTLEDSGASIADMERDLLAAREERSSLDAELTALKETADSSALELETMRNNMKDLEENAEEQIEKKVEEMKAQISTLETEVEAKTKLVEDLEQSVSEYRSTEIELAEQIDKLEGEMEKRVAAAAAEAAKKAKSKDDQLAKKEKEIDSVRKAKEAAIAASKELKTELDELAKKGEEFEAVLKEKEEALAAAEQLRAEMDGLNESAKHEREMLVEDNQAKITSMEKQLAQTTAELEQKSNRIAVLERSVNDALADNDAALDRANSETSRLEDALKAAEDELAQISGDLERATLAAEDAVLRVKSGEQKRGDLLQQMNVLMNNKEETLGFVRSLQKDLLESSAFAESPFGERLREMPAEGVDWSVLGSVIRDIEQDRTRLGSELEEMRAQRESAPASQESAAAPSAPAAGGDVEALKKSLFKLRGCLLVVQGVLEDRGLEEEATMSQNVLEEVDEAIDLEDLKATAAVKVAKPIKEAPGGVLPLEEVLPRTEDIFATLDAAEASMESAAEEPSDGDLEIPKTKGKDELLQPKATATAVPESGSKTKKGRKKGANGNGKAKEPEPVVAEAAVHAAIAPPVTEAEVEKEAEQPLKAAVVEAPAAEEVAVAEAPAAEKAAVVEAPAEEKAPTDEVAKPAEEKAPADEVAKPESSEPVPMAAKEEKEAVVMSTSEEDMVKARPPVKKGKGSKKKRGRPKKPADE